MQFLIQGDRGIWVEYLQLALTRAGYPTRIDGIFGEHTCQGAERFYRKYGCVYGKPCGMGAVKTISDRIPHAYDRKGRYGLWTVAQIWDNGGGNPCGKSVDRSG